MKIARSSSSPGRALMRQLQREAVVEAGLSMKLAKSLSADHLRAAIASVRLARANAQIQAAEARARTSRAAFRARERVASSSLPGLVIPRL